MTKASEIVKLAFREINLKGIGVALTDPEAAEGLTLLNSYISSLFGFELGEFRTPWPVPPSVTSPVPARHPLFPASEELPSDVFPYPPANVNILLTLVADLKMYLPQKPDDGAGIKIVDVGSDAVSNLTLEGNGRLVKGAANLVGTAASLNTTQLFYRADLGDWTGISTLLNDTESPFPVEYDTLLSIGTAARLATRFGRSISREQDKEWGRLLRKLKSQYRQEVPAPLDPQPFIRPASDRSRGALQRSLIE